MCYSIFFVWRAHATHKTHLGHVVRHTKRMRSLRLVSSTASFWAWLAERRSVREAECCLWMGCGSAEAPLSSAPLSGVAPLLCSNDRALESVALLVRVRDRDRDRDRVRVRVKLRVRARARARARARVS